MGKILIAAGIFIAAVGTILVFSGRIPWFGKLPGDISIEREHFRIYIPLATSIVLSLILSLVLYVISQLRK